MSTTALPKSKAKTAYGLLSEIRKIILDEPKRYSQYTLIQFGEPGEEDDLEGDYCYDFPSCGTIGCVAGWVYALKNPRARIRFAIDEPLEFVVNKLKLTEDQSNELFSGTVVSGFPQTQDHAINGAEHIAKFQKKYAAQLKRTRV